MEKALKNEWYINKKDNNNPNPQNSSEFDSSWEVSTIGGGIFGIGASSPWISAPKFNMFWSTRVNKEYYHSSYIRANPGEMFNKPFYFGDVVQISSDGSIDKTFHTLYITSYQSVSYNVWTYGLTYHSNDSIDTSLISLANFYKDATFIFYKMI